MWFVIKCFFLVNGPQILTYGVITSESHNLSLACWYGDLAVLLSSFLNGLSVYSYQFSHESFPDFRAKTNPEIRTNHAEFTQFEE